MIELPIIGEDDDGSLFHVRYDEDNSKPRAHSEYERAAQLGGGRSYEPPIQDKLRAVSDADFVDRLGAGARKGTVSGSTPRNLTLGNASTPRGLYVRAPSPLSENSELKKPRTLSDNEQSALLNGGRSYEPPTDLSGEVRPYELREQKSYQPIEKKRAKTHHQFASSSATLQPPSMDNSFSGVGTPPDSPSLRGGHPELVRTESPTSNSREIKYENREEKYEQDEQVAPRLGRNAHKRDFTKQVDVSLSKLRGPSKASMDSGLASALSLLEKKTREDEFPRVNLLPLWRPKPCNLKEAIRVLTLGTSLTTYLLLKPESVESSASISELAEAVAKNRAVTNLNLSNNHLGDSAITALSPALMMNTTLTLLNLSNNAIPGNSLPVFRLGLEKNTTLIELDLSYNPLGEDGKEIGAFLGGLSIRRLGLAGNNLGPEAMKSIAPALGHCMTELNLKDNLLEDIGVSLLVDTLKKHPSIRSLNLAENKVGIAGMKALVELFEDMQWTSLDLSGNTFGEEGVELLAEAIGTKRALSVLNLSNIPLGQLGVKAVSRLLEKNNYLHCIDLSYTQLESNGIQSISEALKINSTTLCCLKLDGILLDAGGAQYLSHVLKSTISLEQLSLQDCKIAVDAAHFISLGLQDNHTLKELNISRNNWQNMNDILDQVEQHKKLEVLYIYNVEGDLPTLLDRLSRLSTKKKIHIKHSGNKLFRAKILASNMKRRIDPIRSGLVFFSEFIQFAAFPFSIKNLPCQTATVPNAFTNLFRFFHGIQFDWEASFSEKYWVLMFLVGLFLIPFLPIRNERILLHNLKRTAVFSAWDLLITGLSVVLFVPTTRTLLTGISCTLFSSGPSHLDINPDILCWRGDHQPMAGAAFLALPLFLFFCLRLSRVEGSILRTDCMPWSYWDWSQDSIEGKDYLFYHRNPTRSLIVVLATFILVAFSVFLAPYPTLLLVVYLVVSLAMIVSTTLYPPYKEPWVSSFKVGLFFAVAWSNVVGLVTHYTCHADGLNLTLYVYLGGFFPIVAIGTLASILPVRYRKQLLDLADLRHKRKKSENLRQINTYRAKQSFGGSMDESSMSHDLTLSQSNINEATSTHSLNISSTVHDKSADDVKEVEMLERAVREKNGIHVAHSPISRSQSRWVLSYIPSVPYLWNTLIWTFQGLIWVMMVWFGSLCLKSCLLETVPSNSSLVIVLGFIGAWVSAATGLLSLEIANKTLSRLLVVVVVLSMFFGPIALAIAGSLCLSGRVGGCSNGAGAILTLLGWIPIAVFLSFLGWFLFSQLRYRNVGNVDPRSLSEQFWDALRPSA